MARPATICTLSTGKIIDAHVGFVETFNWMKDTLAGLSRILVDIEFSIEGEELNANLKYWNVETGFEETEKRLVATLVKHSTYGVS